MRVSVLEPWRVIYEGNAKEAVLPGEDGELCVLDFHHPFLYRLCRGVIALQPAGARIPIADGVARMTGNELVILVEAERK